MAHKFLINMINSPVINHMLCRSTVKIIVACGGAWQVAINCTVWRFPPHSLLPSSEPLSRTIEYTREHFIFIESEIREAQAEENY